MPSAWYLDKKIVMMKYQGVLTREDAAATARDACTLLDAAKHPQVHIIVDNRAVKKYDFDLQELKTVFADFTRYPNLGFVIVINSEGSLYAPIIRMLSAAALQVVGLRFRVFDDFDTGLSFLLESDKEFAPARFNRPLYASD